MKRPFVLMALGMFTGICTAAYGQLWQAVAAGSIVTAFVFVCCSKSTTARKKSKYVFLQTILVLCMIVAGWQRYIQNQNMREQYLPYTNEGCLLTVQGKLSQKDIKGTQYIYQLSPCAITSFQGKSIKNLPVYCNRILVYPDADIASIGETLILNGTVELWHTAANEGNFDEKSFYEARGIDIKLKNMNLQRKTGKCSRFREALFLLRQKLKDIYCEAMGEREGGVMTAMVTGNKNVLPGDVRQLYQMGGLSHILTISGLHISLLGMLLYRLLCKCGCGFGISGAVAGSAMYLYAIFVGMGISVKRSVLMFLLMLGAQVVGRSYDSLNALGITALFLLWENPLIVGDAGFWFSYMAVIGIVWLGKRTDPKEKEENRKLQKLRDGFRAGIAIQFATLPLVAWFYFEIPVYAVLLNVFVLPGMGGLLLLGLLGGSLGLRSVALAGYFLFPCKKLLKIIEWLCGLFIELPGAVLITGKPTLWKMILYYMLLAATTVWMQKKSIKKPYKIILRCLLLLVLFYRPVGGFELDVLDVGQGDGSFMQTEEGSHVFVDGGSSDIKKVGEYRILPFLKSKGIRKIDFWFVSHTDLDHVSGLQEILEKGYAVEYLVFAEETVRDERYDELVRLAEENNTKLLFMQEGNVLHLKGAKMLALSPIGGELYTDKNAASLVLLYEDETFCAFFGGDIDEKAEGLLAEKMAAEQILPERKIDVYKASHHGAKTSSSPELLGQINPRITTISCGMHNSYGHPAKETLGRLKEVGSEIFCTMHDGQIKLTYKKGKIWIETFRKQENIYVLQKS